MRTAHATNQHECRRVLTPKSSKFICRNHIDPAFPVSQPSPFTNMTPPKVQCPKKFRSQHAPHQNNHPRPAKPAPSLRLRARKISRNGDSVATLLVQYQMNLQRFQSNLLTIEHVSMKACPSFRMAFGHAKNKEDGVASCTW
jgi:hypothetical protein